MSESKLIYQKISAVMSELNAIDKNQANKIQGFNFRGIDDIYNELHSKLVKNKIFTVPEVIEERREERSTKNGGIMTHVILKIKYTMYAEDGSNISSVVIGEGSDTGDKASNKAMSVAHKYFFIQLLAIPTKEEKDPDFESHNFQQRSNSVKIPIKTMGDIEKEDGKSLHQALQDDMKNAEDPKQPSSKYPFKVPAAFENSEIQIGDYVAKIGKTGGPILGKALKDIEPEKLMDFMRYLRGNDPIQKPTAQFLTANYTIEFIAMAEDFINEQKQR